MPTLAPGPLHIHLNHLHMPLLVYRVCEGLVSSMMQGGVIEVYRVPGAYTWLYYLSPDTAGIQLIWKFGCDDLL